MLPSVYVYVRDCLEVFCRASETVQLLYSKNKPPDWLLLYRHIEKDLEVSTPLGRTAASSRKRSPRHACSVDLRDEYEKLEKFSS